jgi:hypothetical protein
MGGAAMQRGTFADRTAKAAPEAKPAAAAKWEAPKPAAPGPARPSPGKS